MCVWILYQVSFSCISGRFSIALRSLFRIRWLHVLLYDNSFDYCNAFTLLVHNEFRSSLFCFSICFSLSYALTLTYVSTFAAQPKHTYFNSIARYFSHLLSLICKDAFLFHTFYLIENSLHEMHNALRVPFANWMFSEFFLFFFFFVSLFRYFPLGSDSGHIRYAVSLTKPCNQTDSTNDMTN